MAPLRALLALPAPMVPTAGVPADRASLGRLFSGEVRRRLTGGSMTRAYADGSVFFDAGRGRWVASSTPAEHHLESGFAGG